MKTEIILTKQEYESTFYMLQPSFYMEAAETALMEVLTSWVKEFAKQTEVKDESKRKQVVLANLSYYLQTFLDTLTKEL